MSLLDGIDRSIYGSRDKILLTSETLAHYCFAKSEISLIRNCRYFWGMKPPKTIKKMVDVIKEASDIVGEIRTYYGYNITSEISKPGRKIIRKAIRQFIPKEYHPLIKERVIFSSGLHQMPDKDGYYISADTLSFKIILLSYRYELDLDLPEDEYYFEWIASTIVHEIYHFLNDVKAIDLEPYKKLHGFLYTFYKRSREWIGSESKIREILKSRYPEMYSSRSWQNSIMDFLNKIEHRLSLFPDGAFSTLDEFISNYESDTRVFKDYPKLLKLFGG